MKKLKNFFLMINHFVNSLHYFNSSITKNTYPYKLVGEKINPLEKGTVVFYKVRGQQKVKEIFLHELLGNKKLIERFHPNEALKLGSMALEDIVFVLPESQQKNKFHQIKNIMLHSIHEFYPDKGAEPFLMQHIYPSEIDDSSIYPDSLVEKNFYPYKLVAGKPSLSTQGTTIIYTILGKREGYEKSLQELVENKKLLVKFHPTEAIKFGFIALGDILFELPETDRNQKLKQMKFEMFNT